MINANQIMSMLMNQKTNPIVMNAINMVQNNDARGIENLARNLCKEKGVNADKLLGQIKSQFNMN